MGAQTRTDILPYISLIPVFGHLLRGMSMMDMKHAARRKRGGRERVILNDVTFN